MLGSSHFISSFVSLSFEKWHSWTKYISRFVNLLIRLSSSKISHIIIFSSNNRWVAVLANVILFYWFKVWYRRKAHMKDKVARDEEKLTADLKHFAIVNYAVCLKMEKLEYHIRITRTIVCASSPHSCQKVLDLNSLFLVCRCTLIQV